MLLSPLLQPSISTHPVRRVSDDGVKDFFQAGVEGWAVAV